MQEIVKMPSLSLEEIEFIYNATNEEFNRKMLEGYNPRTDGLLPEMSEEQKKLELEEIERIKKGETKVLKKF